MIHFDACSLSASSTSEECCKQPDSAERQSSRKRKRHGNRRRPASRARGAAAGARRVVVVATGARAVCASAGQACVGGEREIRTLEEFTVAAIEDELEGDVGAVLHARDTRRVQVERDAEASLA